jgi:hypothetical protein
MKTRYDLVHEGGYLFRHLFGIAADAKLLTRYRDANLLLKVSVEDGVTGSLMVMIERDLDVAAIEYILRLQNRGNPVSCKVAIATYLAEGDPRYNRIFQTRSSGIGKGIFMMLKIAFSIVTSLAKGKYLVWRYRLG